MRKYFAIFLSVCLLVSLVALTGCSLWGYDDDDDVVAPAATMSASGKVDLSTGGGSLRGAVTLADNLKAQAYLRSLVGGVATDAKVGEETEVSSTDGTYKVTFPAAAGYYFVKITSADKPAFELFTILGTLAVTDTEKTADVDSETTAVAFVAFADPTKLEEPATIIEEKAADVATVKTAVETAITNETAVEVKATAVALNKSTTGIFVGATETLTATVTPTYATDKTVAWTSSAATIASVNTTGVVTGVAAGVATITVTTTDGDFTATCLVTVSEVPVTGVTLNKNATTLTVGANETLTANVAPSNAADKTVAWTTSAVGIASVNNGVVTAVAPGVATITVTTTDGGFTATCLVTVAVQTTTNVTLSGPVPSKALGDVFIKITGVPSDFTTTVTLPDTTSKNWVLSKDATHAAAADGSLILITQADEDGTAVDMLSLMNVSFSGFSALTFSTGLPTGAQVFVMDQGADPYATLAQSNQL